MIVIPSDLLARFGMGFYRRCQAEASLSLIWENPRDGWEEVKNNFQ
jgi:hypothetical protein